MKYLQFTHVDAVTGISVAAEPAQNGPVFPTITGLQFEWARESQYPTPVPAFFGTCPADSLIDVAGMVAELSQTDYEQMRVDEMSRRPTDRDRAKLVREEAVENSIVTTTTGKTFDGDEVAQTRMARAIIGMQVTGAATIVWVLADNTTTQATLAELTEALCLAGQAQADIWVIS